MKGLLGPILFACAVALAAAASGAAIAQSPPAVASAAAVHDIKQEELDAMLAPIALYPDALLSQVLMASTYPLEVVEAARWAEQNKGLKGDALSGALQQQAWDESVKSLCAFPEVLDRMNKDLAWTQKLGDAFLAQQQQVMDTVQSLRKKAQANGSLESNAQQKVVVEKEYITVEPANPQVVYVPAYQPTVVYGAWPYPAYPPYYPPYWAAPGAAFVRGVAWGAGIAAGAALWGGFNWNNHDVNINVNRYNNFNRTNISNNTWQHNVSHRGGVPYRDDASRQHYGGHDRQAAQARQQFRGREGELGGRGLQDHAGLQGAANRGVGSAGSRAAEQNRGAAREPSRTAGRDVGGFSHTRGENAGGFDVGHGGQARTSSARGHASMAGRGGGGMPRAGGGMHGGGGHGRR